MNGGLIGGILLMAYSIYSGYQAKTENLDWTPLLNAKVWGGGLVGVGTILYHLKDSFMAYWASLPGLNEKTKVIEVKEKTLENVPPEVKELDVTDIESEDLYCLSYLMKRIKKSGNEEALTLIKSLHDKFFDIHSSEVVVPPKTV